MPKNRNNRGGANRNRENNTRRNGLMETIISGPATSTPAGERGWEGSQEHMDSTIYYEDDPFYLRDPTEGSMSYVEQSYGGPLEANGARIK